MRTTPTPSLNTNTNYCRLCDDTLELGFKEYNCSETNQIIYVDVETPGYEISCGTVSSCTQYLNSIYTYTYLHPSYTVSTHI